MPGPNRAAPADDSYLVLSDKVTHLAEARIAKGDSAEMELYAGLGWMLRARLLALRNERRATAHAGVMGRERFLRCLELDPQMADADTGLGIYNYYVDTLSAIAKVLRIFMGIPGGNKQDGIRQLETAMQQGVLTRVTARFYLAKNLRTFELDYVGSIAVMTPLVTEFPQNPMFQLILGDTEAKLNHKELAAASFRAAERSPVSGHRLRRACPRNRRAGAGRACWWRAASDVRALRRPPSRLAHPEESRPACGQRTAVRRASETSLSRSRAEAAMRVKEASPRVRDD